MKKINSIFFYDQFDLLITKNSRFHKKHYLFLFLTVFPLFIAKDWIAPIDLRSFLNKDGIHLLLLIFEKDWHYRFEHCNFFSTSTGLIWSFSRSNWSFDHKKTIDSIKRQMIEFSTLLLIDLKGKKVLKIGGYIRLTMCVQVIVDYSEFRTEQ